MHAEAIAAMNRMIRLDLDTIGAYESAATACSVPAVKVLLDELRHDHERHVIELGEQVRALGGAPETHAGLKGLLLRGFARITSRGDHSALMAVRAAEELCARLSVSAMRAELPVPARVVLERSHEDEKLHRARLDEALSNRLWETVSKAPRPRRPRAGDGGARQPTRAERAASGDGATSKRPRRGTSKTARAAIHTATTAKSPRRGKRHPRVRAPQQ
jgi:uncharacterized protein (TIGR02284 family)